MSIYSVTIKLFGIPIFTIKKSWDQKVNGELTTLMQSLQGMSTSLPDVSKDLELAKLETV